MPFTDIQALPVLLCYDCYWSSWFLWKSACHTYHILTSSVISCRTDTWQYGIFLWLILDYFRYSLKTAQFLFCAMLIVACHGRGCPAFLFHRWRKSTILQPRSQALSPPPPFYCDKLCGFENLRAVDKNFSLYRSSKSNFAHKECYNSAAKWSTNF